MRSRVSVISPKITAARIENNEPDGTEAVLSISRRISAKIAPPDGQRGDLPLPQVAYRADRSRG
jgi:hypothetical protein